MKTKHKLWQLTVLFISMILCILSTAEEAINAGPASKGVAITRGGSYVASQTLTLKRGWNWAGFNVLPTSRTVGDVLGTTGFTVNDSIQTNGGSARFMGTSWTPESFAIEYGKLYQIYVANNIQVMINGVASGPYSLPLIAGWNWIANSTLENVALSQLTHSGGWAENDHLQAAGGNGAAYISGKWIPAAFTLEAGKGYQVFAGNAGTLSFPTPVDDELYVVVDLSGGPDATNYPVRYTNEAPDLDDDTCRTTELWLRRIPAGTFIMGSPEDEVGRSSIEKQHEVTLTQDYYIGVFECTQKQFELVMGGNPSGSLGDCRPVENVTYSNLRGTGAQAGAGWPTYGHAVDASSFMGKLQAKTGLTFDLPTEAQWEYACRAGTTTALNSGKNLTTVSTDAAMDEVGRYRGNTNDGIGGYSMITTVGSYLPNAWGLYDMHGNAQEWCLDWYANYGTAAVVDPVGPATGSYGSRVVRSGGWYQDAFACRSAKRESWPSLRSNTHGFRVALHPLQNTYAVVDLSSGPDATNYPVRYTNTAPNLDDDTCRTTELWLRRIPAGTFIMGSPEDEEGRQSRDMAQHEVTLTQDFYIGVFECTQKQFELVMGYNPSTNCGDNRPVETVSYQNELRGVSPSDPAVAGNSFFAKLQAKTGLDFDLPTEAQWEYACRAGTTTALNSGKNLTSTELDIAMDEVGRYYYNQSDGKGGDTSAHTKVGCYLPNAWGLYDMHGNVGEYSKDWYGMPEATSVVDPNGPSSGTYIVERGGSWRGGAGSVRSAFRASQNLVTGSDNFGFRVASHLRPVIYSVSVGNGTVVTLMATVGTAVEITAAEPPEGMVFDRWVSDDVEFADATATTTTFTMPAKAVAVRATYALDPNMVADDSMYAVVDLSGGPNAVSYPVRYTNEGPNLDDDTSRTTELWLRKIPKGTFVMGSPEDELGRDNTEKQHEVTLTQDFYIGVFECTQKQFELVMGGNPSESLGDCRPVENVTYSNLRGTGEQAGAGWPTYGHAVDASSFMGKLQTKTGLTFDLPTEAQWEYACRARTATALNSGKNLTWVAMDAAMDEVGRYRENWYDGKGGYSVITKVGSYLPNAWGLYDMHGNVEEWCLDWSANYGTVAVSDPVGPNTGSYRVLRSGSWYGNASECRSAKRESWPPLSQSNSHGFRVAIHFSQNTYAVVDLSGGPDATNYPVRYTNNAPNLEDDTCRTTELWLRKIPKGTFIMGSPEDEVGRQSYDMAQHEVTITEDYYIGVFECTQKQWELVMGSNPSTYKDDCRPVEYISYNMIRGSEAQAGAGWPTYGHTVDASSFMGKLQTKTGLVFDLPTEAQWEYACRAGTTTALNSGKNLTNATSKDANMDEVGRYDSNQSDDKWGYSQHTKVGSYLPNAWGLYDMHGNVWEWTLDWYGVSTTSTAAETDPVGPSSGSRHVFRGGSWEYMARDCRSVSRSNPDGSPTCRWDDDGFRVVCLP